jgi:hypothetical protein
MVDDREVIELLDDIVLDAVRIHYGSVKLLINGRLGSAF